MRTTLDLDDRLMRRIRRTALEEGKSLKEVVNRALAQAIGERSAAPAQPRGYRCPVFPMGHPAVNLDKALSLVDRMEEAAVLTKLEMRK